MPVAHTSRPGAFSAVLLVGATLAACAGPVDPRDEAPTDATSESALFGWGEPSCPSARELGPNESPSLWAWRTRREISLDVFANDGAEVLGVEHAYELMKSWDPLNDRGISTRRDCHRAFSQKLDGTGRHYLDAAQVLGSARPTAFMRTAGYATLDVASQDRKGPATQVRLDLATGTRRALVSQPWSACAVQSQAIPSPSGDRIALLTLSTTCGTSPGPWTATVAMLDGSGAPRSGPSTRGFAGAVEGTWRPDGAFVVTDLVEAATAEASGAFVATSVPRCVSPKTTSSNVDARGRMIDAMAPNGAVIFGTATYDVFGCQD